MFFTAPIGASHASEINREGVWDPRHIDNLPPDVRHYISNICKGPARAQHDFATYLPSEHRWRINLEYLHCDGLERYRQDNQCLDVDFVEKGSHFLLASKEFRACGY
jgi:hypothetical protein